MNEFLPECFYEGPGYVPGEESTYEPCHCRRCDYEPPTPGETDWERINDYWESEHDYDQDLEILDDDGNPR